MEETSTAGIDAAPRLAALPVDEVAAKAMQLMIEHDPQPPLDRTFAPHRWPVACRAPPLRRLDVCFDISQYRHVSKQSVPVEEPVPCCPPLAQSALSADRAGDLAAMFKALGDPVRLRLVSMVASHEGGEACVCDLTPAFEVSPPTISHHLRVLRESGLLECERRGTWVFYRVVPTALAQLAAVLGPADLLAPAAPSGVPA